MCSTPLSTPLTPPLRGSLFIHGGTLTIVTRKTSFFFCPLRNSRLAHLPCNLSSAPRRRLRLLGRRFHDRKLKSPLGGIDCNIHIVLNILSRRPHEMLTVIKVHSIQTSRGIPLCSHSSRSCDQISFALFTSHVPCNFESQRREGCKRGHYAFSHESKACLARHDFQLL